MNSGRDRLRSLLADELGECTETDVSRRLAELDDLLEEAGVADVSTDVGILSTLGNETRYRIVRLLATADDELCVCEFAPLLDRSESTVSHSLTTLADAGLVERRREGKWHYYRATPFAERLLDALDAGREGADA
jgi:DNA-binding transcriptional ArsR family regulator